MGTKEIVQTNGPFKGKGNIQTVVTNDKFGYEVGYIESNNLDTDDLNIIEHRRNCRLENLD